MSKKDWLDVGLKVVGAYFGVFGLALCAAILSEYFVHLLTDMADEEASIYNVGGPYNPSALARPAVFLVASYVLIWRTQWFVDRVTRQ